MVELYRYSANIVIVLWPAHGDEPAGWHAVDHLTGRRSAVYSTLADLRLALDVEDVAWDLIPQTKDA